MADEVVPDCSAPGIVVASRTLLWKTSAAGNHLGQPAEKIENCCSHQ